MGRVLFTGMAAGAALEAALALGISGALHLGYVMLCPAWLPEAVGGEARAVFLETLLFVLAGGACALLTERALRRARPCLTRTR